MRASRFRCSFVGHVLLTEAGVPVPARSKYETVATWRRQLLNRFYPIQRSKALGQMQKETGGWFDGMGGGRPAETDPHQQ